IRPFPPPLSTEEAWRNILDVTYQAELTSWAVTQEVDIAFATQFPQTCYGKRPTLSPDGNWLAVDCELDDQIRIANRDGSRLWKVDYESLFTPSEDMGEMSIIPWVDHWSNDSRYVYIGWYLCCWNPGGPVLYSNSNIERFDIVTGDMSYVISGNMSYSFSPDDRLLIEIPQPVSPIVLQIHDLATGEITELILELDPKYEQAGLITWSPDGLKIVLIAAYGMDVMDFTQAMILIDVEKLSQKVLLKDVRDDIGDISWTEDNTLTYTTTDYSSEVPVITTWRRNMSTLELRTATP
ncbi:MAG TPA: hypothetical protein VLS45_07485, partial [Methylomicrobium sp.]|nr:hypothetical protein [Methylomicrobium sp.]